MVDDGRVVGSVALAQVNDTLRADGRVHGWRGESFALFDPTSLAVLARIERAASRF